MAFISDNTEFRTYDPERGYELFRTGGGSDGTYRFRIASPNGGYNFFPHYYKEKLRPDEIERPRKNFVKKGIVWNIHNWKDDWKSVIREAMVAFAINYGSRSPDLQAFVRFGTKGSVFDV